MEGTATLLCTGLVGLYLIKKIDFFTNILPYCTYCMRCYLTSFFRQNRPSFECEVRWKELKHLAFLDGTKTFNRRCMTIRIMATKRPFNENKLNLYHTKTISMKHFHIFILGIALICLTYSNVVNGQVSISQAILGNDGILPTTNSIAVGLGTYDARTADWELYALAKFTHDEIFEDNNFESEANRHELRFGLRFYPFGVQDHLLWSRHMYAKGKRISFHRSQRRAKRIRTRKTSYRCGAPLPLKLPGIHLGLSYGYTGRLQETRSAGQPLVYDQKMLQHSVGGEVGYSLSVELLSIGIHCTPLQYNWTTYSSQNPIPFVGQGEAKTQGFSFTPAWRLRVGIRLF